MGTVIVYAVLIILLNLIVDLLYGLLDPQGGAGIVALLAQLVTFHHRVVARLAIDRDAVIGLRHAERHETKTACTAW